MKFTIIVLLLLKTALVRSIWPFDSIDTAVTPQVSGSIPRIISLFSETQTDELVGDYIEFVEGDNISLLCNTPYKMPVTYHLPNLTEYKDYNDTDYYARKRAGPNHYNKTLFISDAKITDTGSYGCSYYKDPKLSHYIYVFIRSRFGNEHFIPTNANIYLANEKTLVVPCKANKNMNESLVELWTFREEWKGDDIVYDPRIGFQISISETRPIREYLSLSCTYDPEWSHFENKEFFDRNFEVTWEKIGQWKHVGMSLNLTCNVQHAREDGNITIHCPRCKNVVFEQHSSLHRLIAVIENLTMEDAGNYECRVLLSNGTLYKQATVNLAVSPTKGQIRIEHVSPEIIILNESHGYRIQVNFTYYPFILGQYNTTWTREYTRAANKSFVVSEDVSSMAMRSEQKTSLAYEELNLLGLTANQSGIYVLTIQIFDFSKRIEFNVTVHSRKPTVNMTIATSTNYTILGEKHYPSGSRVDIFCKVEAVPLMNDIELSYKYPLGDWNQVSRNDLEVSHGTYETLIHWDTIVRQSQEVQCTARKGKKFTEKLDIGVADGKPRAVYSHIRGPTALDGENEKEIYEGDNLELSCVHPINDEWNVVWMHNEEEIPIKEEDIIFEGASRILKISLSNVSATDNEVYTCAFVNSKEKTPLVLPVSFSVLKIQTPIVSTRIESDVKLEYGQLVNLSCPLSGVPKPKIAWYKDGQPYHLGVSDVNGTLTIQRVTIEDKGVFMCKATNRAGEKEVSFTAKVIGGPYTQHELIVIGSVASVVIFAVVGACIGYLLYNNCKMKKTNKDHLIALGKLYEQLMSQIPPNFKSHPKGLKIPLDQRLTEIAYDRKYELEKDQLSFGNMLGVGQFGKVCQGTLTRGEEGTQEPTTVAIKQPLIGSNPEHQTMLVQELKIMCALDNHPNVIALLGAVTKFMRNGELHVVVEYCDNGNLKNYIVARKNNFSNELSSQELNEDGTPEITQYVSEAYIYCDGGPPQRHAHLSDPTSLSTSDLLSFALQIAKGMNYLSNVPCVHRDLALRNVLVTSNRVIRIADFGLARNMRKEYYKMRRKGKKTPLPVRWMSIEAIEDGMYTVASDIWSYGIVLYELFSLAGQPYPGFGNDDLLEKLKNGYRNPKPKYSHEEICQLMEQCCEEDPKRRPNFNRCVEVTKNHLRRCNLAMLEHVEAKTKSEADYQNQLVRWARQEETNYPIRHDSFVALPQMQPKRNSSFLKTVGNFFGGLMKKPSNTTPSAELVPLTETQSLPECHNSNGSVPIAVSHSPSESRPRSEVPSPTESQKHSYLPIGDHPASEAYPLIGSNPPSESYLPIGPYPPSEPHSPV